MKIVTFHNGVPDSHVACSEQPTMAAQSKGVRKGQQQALCSATSYLYPGGRSFAVMMVHQKPWKFN